MNLEPLNITKRQAAEAVVNYRRALKLKANAEYEAILRGYNQVLKGRKLIELSKVIVAGGVDEKFRPRLAVFRADQTRCAVEVWPDGRVRFHEPRGHWRATRSLNLNYPAGTLPAFKSPNSWDRVTAEAMVPIIPPQHMPVDKLSNYHVLWEAEWRATAPKDPALLKHLGGDLWAVLAVWDLTDLERAVLAGTRNN